MHGGRGRAAVSPARTRIGGERDAARIARTGRHAALLQQLQQVYATTQAQAEVTKQRLSRAETEASQAEAASQRLAQAELESNQANAAWQAAYQALNMVAQPQQTTPATEWFDYPNTAYIEELEQAVKSKSVSFSQTLLALRIGSDARRPMAHTKRARERGAGRHAGAGQGIPAPAGGPMDGREVPPDLDRLPEAADL
jgi:hypothetical protein